MSTAPGVLVTDATATRKRKTGFVPGTLFIPMVSVRGPHGVATELYSTDELEAVYGARDTRGLGWDALDIALKEGGAERVYAARIVGPSAVKASINLADSVPATTLTITAKEYGSYWNATTVANVLTAGNSVLTITEPDGTVHTSPSLADPAAAVAWVATLANYTATAVKSTDPVSASAAAMTGGDDNFSGITETERATARALFDKDLGCGIIIEPSNTTTAGALALAAHAAANNRVALTDIATGVSVASSATQGAVTVDSTNARRLKVNRSWAVVAGLTEGTTRTVPWSVIEAGMIGRNLSAGVPVGQPAAGKYGISRTAQSLVTEFNATDRATLNDARVNVARTINADGTIRGYGNRSMSSADAEKQFSEQFTRMVIQAEAELAGEDHVQVLQDGQKIDLSKFLRDLIALCQKYYDEGSLFGESASDAFLVEVFDVNPDDQLLAGYLHAEIDVRTSPAAEFTRINITAHAESIGA